MRLYPSLPRRRTATLAGDLAVVALVVLFAVLGKLVHDAVFEMTTLGRGVQDAGMTLDDSTRDAVGAVRGGLDRAAGAVQGAPVIGGPVADGLRGGAAEATRGIEREATQAATDVIAVGREGEQRVVEAANVLGWTTFLVPLVLVLARFVPPRVAQVRQLTAAQAVLADPGDDPERSRVLAERAAFGLPYATLVRHTRDPLGDLLSGDHAPLHAALGEDAGLELPRRG